MVSDPGRLGQHNTLSPFPSPFRSPFRSPLHCSPFKNLGHATGHCALDLDCDDDDMNLGCFILMFDLILKQVASPYTADIGSIIEYCYILQYLIEYIRATKLSSVPLSISVGSPVQQCCSASLPLLII